MPIYEYQCQGCHYQFDLIQKMSDEPVKTCPKCSEDKAVRWVSAAGFQLKGNGWYATDFKTKKTDTTSTSTDTPSSADSGKTSTTSGSDTE